MTKPPLCPICRRRPTQPEFRPFCSRRCADVDLAQWLGGTYRVSGEEAAPTVGNDDDC